MSDKYEILSTIDSPKDLKDLSNTKLVQLCQELRDYTIEVVSATGGHLSPTLGVVELSVALHKVFDSPKDKIVWDVGHQAYAHKILTGRRESLKTIRQYGGISGFCKQIESEHDAYGAGHASTSISAGVGFAVARDLKGEDNHVISIIGDGALTGGLSFEGLNNLGSLRTKMMVILNDNEMSISRNVGAMSKYLSKITTNPLYNRVREEMWEFTGKLPVGKQTIRTGMRKIEESLKNLLVPGVLFDEMGIRYFGPIDGNDLPLLIETLENIKDINTPVLLHILTKKGMGHTPSEESPDKFHGIGPSKKPTKTNAKPPEPPFLNVFGNELIKLANKDKRVVGITAAMPGGAGLAKFAEEHPSRFYDVGIAEGHAVTFAAGLASNGMKPFVAIYSTFLQRAFDMLMHDIAIQKLPVVFMLDRAGLVGEDGPTHHGVLDLAYLSSIPDVIVAAPRNGEELRHLMQTAIHYEDGPFFIRYPKASSEKNRKTVKSKVLEVGKWEKLEAGSDVAILAVGPMNSIADQAAALLKKDGISAERVDVKFIKPFDEAMLAEVLERHDHVFVIEESNYPGSLSQRIQAFSLGIDNAGHIYPHTLPDRFVTHGTRAQLLAEVKLTPEDLYSSIKEVV
ncbi:MAG: 1-deoxy-D-xylulose-5-phosphate synthase [Candidatus Marinimicrobia bacterium]|nr:1-deoxy-D-xylulose-5-phosphate synthase [Candidatus Neomarinimicrobiota bacterium]MCF7851194.1 1-deoxy-D-xylulose-5-phosphate synthase [Candidatus Neomarinimicrobiota bacterium]MCF7904148.1 1-deoxy-D-xylulose-5-phosphate synthase [Candidatus Neomarinimicrobiota bacterium]